MVAQPPETFTFTYTLNGTTLNYTTSTGENVRAAVKLEGKELRLTARGTSTIAGSQEIVLTLVE